MRVSIGDVRLFFDVEGAGWVPEGDALVPRPTILLLHGGPGFDHSSFKPAYSALCDVAQIVYVDHRGMGRSDRGERDQWRLAQWADDLRALCDRLEIERPVVLGQSFGGFVAGVYAERHPDRIGKLVLSSTAARWDLERVVRAFERVGGPEAADVARRFYEAPGDAAAVEYARVCLPLYERGERDPQVAARVVYNLPLLYHWEAVEGSTMDLRETLSRVHTPTLVLGGEEDPITPIECSVEILASLPAGVGRLERFPDASHGLARDAGQAYFDAIRDFVRA